MSRKDRRNPWPPALDDYHSEALSDEGTPNARERAAQRSASVLDDYASEALSVDAAPDPATTASVAEADVPLPLAEALTSVAPVEWRDAVAIVLQLVDQFSPDGLEPAGTFPDVHQIALAPSGFLLTQLEPRGAVPLAGLGRLLQRLLAEATPPPPLRLLAIQAASASPTLSFADLTRELAEWARPYRHRLLEVLANLYQRAHHRAATYAVPSPTYDRVPGSRAGFRFWPLQPRVLGGVGLGAGVLAVAVLLMLGADAHEPAVPPAVPEIAADSGNPPIAPRVLDADVSLETTRAQVAPPAETRPSSSSRAPVTAPPGRSLTRPSASASASTAPAPRPSAAPEATASAAARPAPRPSPTSSEATTSAAVAPVPRPSPPVPTATVSAAPAGVAPTALAAAAVVPAPQLPATDPDLASYSTSILREAELEFRRARALFDERQYAVAADRFAQVVEILDRGDPALGLRSIASEFAGASRALASHDDADSSRVYTSADEGVTEPVTLATLPRPVTPGTPADQRAVLELLINAQGGVETAHLIDVEQHFRDRWWMSAAKAWLFKPAMKDGKPVRFLKRVVFVASDSGGPQ